MQLRTPRGKPTEGIIKKSRKGQPQIGGRKKGTPNSYGREAQEMIRKAMDMAGEDGAGKGKAVGWLKKQAIQNPKAYLALFAKTLPYQVSGPDNTPLIPIHSTHEVVHTFADRGLPTPPSLMERIHPILDITPHAKEDKELKIEAVEVDDDQSSEQ
jgi:hypothetical protein